MQKHLNSNKKKQWRVVVIIFIILLLLLFLLFISFEKYIFKKSDSGNTAGINGVSQISSITKIDNSNSNKNDSSKLKSVLSDSAKLKTFKKKTVIHLSDSALADTMHVTTISDTFSNHSDSIRPDTIQKIIDPCKSDTTPLWVYPDPSGGLHRTAPQVVFVPNRACVIFWKYQKDSEWKKYDGKPIKIDTTLTLEFKATDSCGKEMETRAEYYEITRSESIKYCPEGMEYIKVGDKKFCIDRYEWPNKKNSMPMSYISLYGASDSCYSVGKRLCTVDEWTLACSGPYSWKYPYGQIYERYACSTHDTAAIPSGKKPECRSFFGVYDMSGDLAEWTDTRAIENKNFYYVKGGFWESGPQSGCYDKRYSYYPQNRHNPVGFRCCKDSKE